MSSGDSFVGNPNIGRMQGLGTSLGARGPQSTTSPHIPLTDDVDLLLGFLISSSTEIPLTQKYDDAVRLRDYIPGYVYAAFLTLAKSIGGMVTLEETVTRLQPDDPNVQRKIGLATAVVLDVYGQIVDNIQALKREMPEYEFSDPPILALSPTASLFDLIREISKTLSNYYRSETGKFLEKKDVRRFVFSSGYLAAAILDPLRTALSMLGR